MHSPMIPCDVNRRRKQALLLAAMLAAVGIASAEPPPRTPPPQGDGDYRGAMHDTTNEQALQKQIAATSSFDAEMLKAKARPQFEGRPEVQSSLLTSSLFLFDGAHYTVIPVGSILFLPKQLRNRVIREPQGDFTFWPNFLKLNSSWLAAKEVPLEMAKGDAKAGEAIMRSLSVNPSNRVLVSVYKNGPISILEPAPESSAEKKANSR